MTRLPQLAREQDPHHLQPMDFAVIPALDRAVASASLRPAREFQHRDPSTAGQHTLDHLPHLLQNR